MSVLRPGTLRVCRPLTMRTSKPAASSTPYRGSQYTPVASIATQRTRSDFNQSRRACSCDVTVPNTIGSSPATDTCMCSLPTSTNAARGSSTVRVFMTHLRVKLHTARGDAGPVASRGMQISPAGSKAHQNVRLIATRTSLPCRQSNLTLDAPKGQSATLPAATP